MLRSWRPAQQAECGRGRIRHRAGLPQMLGTRPTNLLSDQQKYRESWIGSCYYKRG